MEIQICLPHKAAWENTATGGLRNIPLSVGKLHLPEDLVPLVNDWLSEGGHENE